MWCSTISTETGSGSASARSCRSRHSWMLRAATPDGSKARTTMRDAPTASPRPPALPPGLRAEVAALVEVADHRLADGDQDGVVGSHPQLLDEVVGERGLRPAEVLEEQVG